MQPADLVPLLQNASLRRNIDYDDHTGTVSDNGISLKENRPNYSTTPWGFTCSQDPTYLYVVTHFRVGFSLRSSILYWRIPRFDLHICIALTFYLIWQNNLVWELTPSEYRTIR